MLPVVGVFEQFPDVGLCRLTTVRNPRPHVKPSKRPSRPTCQVSCRVALRRTDHSQGHCSCFYGAGKGRSHSSAANCGEEPAQWKPASRGSQRGQRQHQQGTEASLSRRVHAITTWYFYRDRCQVVPLVVAGNARCGMRLTPRGGEAGESKAAMTRPTRCVMAEPRTSWRPIFFGVEVLTGRRVLKRGAYARPGQLLEECASSMGVGGETPGSAFERVVAAAVELRAQQMSDG
jgi:hypothetical protein